MPESHISPAEDRSAAADPAARFAKSHAEALTRSPTVNSMFHHEVNPDDVDTHEAFDSPEDPNSPEHLLGFVGQSHYAFLELPEGFDSDNLRALVPNPTDGPVKLGVGFVTHYPALVRGIDTSRPSHTAAAVLLVPVESELLFGDDPDGYYAFSIQVDQSERGRRLTLKRGLAAPSTGDGAHVSQDPSFWEHQLDRAFGVQTEPPFDVARYTEAVRPDPQRDRGEQNAMLAVFNQALDAAIPDGDATERAERQLQSSPVAEPLTPQDTAALIELVEPMVRQAYTP